MNTMEYWNNAVLEYWVWRNEISFYMVGAEKKYNQTHTPL